MKNYFLISEFAKLRGIDINSLRYYEKLGILKPAYVDEKNNYRYYSTEQLTLLNKIILCIQLGISLKEMATYIDEDGNLQSQKLLEQGRIVAQKRIAEMQNNLRYIESSLKNIEENKPFCGREGKYHRQLDGRKVILGDVYEGEVDIKKVVQNISEIYKTAQKRGFFPLLPAGEIIEIDKGRKVRMRLFLELLNCEEEDPQICILPAGEYSCVQAEMHEEIDLVKIIRENWAEEEEITIIIDNIMLENYSFKTRPSELQKWENSSCQKNKAFPCVMEMV